MSYVASVLLITGIDDRKVEEVQQWLVAKNEYYSPLVNVREYAGGNKYAQRDVWLGAYNYLDIKGLADCVRRVKWDRPDSVQLFVNDENDDKFNLVVELEGPSLFERRTS